MKAMKNLTCLILAIFWSLYSFSAVPERAGGPSPKNFDAIVASTVEALKLPTESRLELLAQLGPRAYKELMIVAFDSNYGMKLQWRALTAMGMLGKTHAMPEIKKALQHKDWYLRNAGLLVLNEINSSEANRWAKKLLSDPSLIVRTEAVGILKKNKDFSARDLLWKKLFDKQNFRGNESLWVRRHIVETLASFKTKGEEMRFLKILDDKDKTLHPVAVAALEELTQKHLGQPHNSIQEQVRLWKQHLAKNHKALKHLSQ